SPSSASASASKRPPPPPPLLAPPPPPLAGGGGAATAIATFAVLLAVALSLPSMDTNTATFTSPATAVLMVYVMVVLAPLASTFNVQLTVVPLLAQPPPGVVARLTASPVTTRL